MSTLADRVARILVILETNQVGLAKIADTSKAQVNHWLQGRAKKIGAEQAFNLQREKGLNAEWVLFGTGPETLAEVKTHYEVRDAAGEVKPLHPSSNGKDMQYERQSHASHWSLHPVSEADYLALPEKGRKYVRGQVALAIAEAKEMFGKAERKRSA